jgi:hypothetical protein
MSGTAPEPGLTPELAPLPAAELPTAVARVCAGPTPMKLLAAKGAAPLRPAELLIALYQLSFDADAAVKAAAEASLANLPDAVVAAPLGEALPAAVLQRFAAALSPQRIALLERILYNPATADGTFVMLAARLREAELEIMFQNEARLLRCPAILEALFHNPAARMSSINRAIELCARNNVRAEGIPAFDEMARAILEDPAATGAGADASFAALSAGLEGDGAEAGPGDEIGDGAALQPVAVDDGMPDLLPEFQPEPAAEAKPQRKGTTIDFTRLKLYEKIRMATLGNAYCRQNLMRDPNRMVAMAAIRSPRITESEIVSAAGNRGIAEDVLRYIANQRDLTKNYQIRLNLVMNPKCPVALTLKFLPLLNGEDLKHVSRSKNIPSALSTNARRLMQTRKPE